ncbi:response regulator [Actinosynnema sp. NPDC047251]|uniref:response regulator n=1 Tax=Saccharothrix espanaensis TaxID=103731 RepID=UPI000310CC34|nr:response regulator [Saccharothrix espanaensis]
MRILIIEDEGMAAQMAVTELGGALPCEVTVVADPVEALVRLHRERFDVAVVDMLYQAHSVEFERRRRRGRVRLTDARLHLSGLAVLRAAHTASPATRTVLWTNGEPNRRLHMMFAHEQLGCRVMCPKDAVGKLSTAVRAAVRDRELIDPVLGMYFPLPSSPTLGETFFTSSTRLAVWRAMALGVHEHTAIGKIAGVTAGTIRRGMDGLRARLVAFDPGCTLDGPPTAEVVRYASQNWQFFLDDTVREFHR